jgi:hypothetical protein
MLCSIEGLVNREWWPTNGLRSRQAAALSDGVQARVGTLTAGREYALRPVNSFHGAGHMGFRGKRAPIRQNAFANDHNRPEASGCDAPGAAIGVTFQLASFGKQRTWLLSPFWSRPSRNGRTVD